MKNDHLHFQWDRDVPAKHATLTGADNHPGKLKRLENYFEFIEQFPLPANRKSLRPRVDRLFTLREGDVPGAAR